MYRLSLFGPFSLTGPGGADVPIASKKARALLAYLAQSPGKPRSREEILALLWSDREEAQGRASLRQVLTGLRKEVGTDLLRIDRDRVALNADAVELNPPNGQAFLASFHLTDPAFEEWLRDERLRLEDAPEPYEPASSMEIAAKPSIVVLPFANLSDDPDDAYFSEGITEDIATELSRFGLINVVARSTVFAMQQSGDPMGNRLSDIQTDYAVEGSLRRSGNRIRLSAKLIERATGQQIWSDRLDRELDDLFALQDELVDTIVTTLSGRIGQHRSDIALRKPASSLAAYDHYLKGEWYTRQYNPESNLSARSEFEKAIELDPSFARAYGALAVTLMVISWNENENRDDDPYEEILLTARKSVELDPTDAANFSDLGVVQLASLQHEASRRSFETALALNPHDPVIWAQYAWFLFAMSQAARAVQFLDRAVAVDPYPPAWFWHVRAEALVGLERYAEAAELYERIPVAYPDMHGQLAVCYGHLGEHQKARQYWAKLLELKPNRKLADIGGDFEYINQADADRWTEGLKKAGIEDLDEEDVDKES